MSKEMPENTTDGCRFQPAFSLEGSQPVFKLVRQLQPAKRIATGCWNPSGDGVEVPLPSQCGKPARRAAVGEEKLASWPHQNTAACVRSALFPATQWSQHRHINPKSTRPCATPTKSINGQILVDYHFQQTLPFFGCGRKSLSIPIYKMHRHLVCRAVGQVGKQTNKKKKINQRSPPSPAHPLSRAFG